ncbi:helix-turn-helix domain-containing protein [Levilactobacillus enshiensis]|uniref:helix-turn-helix domain-containing protein n=1 Tax=Levilactobacillus enshiensis TaxID=2590213 RepID=UPI00117AD723|nr:AraC family transcriptional regulator [Levilactobacillus enshiensis]
MKITITKQFQNFIQQIGLNVAQILQDAGLTHRFQAETLSVTPLEYYRLTVALDERITDAQVLIISDVQRIQLFMPPIFAALSAHDGETALQRFTQFKQLIGPVMATTEETSRTLSVHFDFIYPQQAQMRVALLLEQYMLVSLLRTGTGKRIQPLVTAGPFDYHQAGEHFLGGHQEKRRHNQLTFAKADLRRPFLTENNVMWAFMEPELKQRLAEITTAESFAGTVQQMLFTAIPAGKFTLAEVAQGMGMSPRSVQRNLEAETTSYQQQVKKVQRLLAINYLALKTVTPTEIAYLVGYNSPSAFSRAFKQWTGQTLTEYRTAGLAE